MCKSRAVPMPMTMISAPGVRLNIKMPSYKYRDSHVKDKTVSPTVFIFNMRIPIPGKDGLYIEPGPCSHIPS